MSSCYAGADPGKTGSVWVVDASGNIKAGVSFAKYKSVKLSDQEKAIAFYSAMSHIRKYTDSICIELVHSMPTDGLASAFTFGGQVEKLIYTCHLLRFNVCYVQPLTWQNAVKCTSKGNKSKHLAVAKELMLGRTSGAKTRLTKETADGFLIAEYFRMKEQGLINKLRVQEASGMKWL